MLEVPWQKDKNDKKFVLWEDGEVPKTRSENGGEITYYELVTFPNCHVFVYSCWHKPSLRNSGARRLSEAVGWRVSKRKIVQEKPETVKNFDPRNGTPFY